MVMRILVLLLALSLAGCGPLLPAPDDPPWRHDFGPLPDRVPEHAITAEAMLLNVSAPSWLAGSRIPYRQLHRGPESLRYYAQHAWVASPAELVEQRLLYLLPDARRRNGPWQLELEIASFEQVFDAADSARAVIVLRASLRDRDGGGVEQRTFRIEQAVQPDVQGAISGLPRVADAALDDVLTWLAEVTAS